jgi:hypothetical protein
MDKFTKQLIYIVVLVVVGTVSLLWRNLKTGKYKY